MNENDEQMKQSLDNRTPFPTKILLIGVVILIASMVGSGCLIIYMVSNMHSGFVRFALPGTKELELTETGFYSVYYEYQSKLDGKYYNSPNQFPDMALSLRKKGQNTELALNRPENRSSSYSWKDTSGKLEFEFAINEPGTYEFAGKYDSGKSTPEIVLSIGKEHLGSFISIFVGVGIAFIVLFCVMIFIAVKFLTQFRVWFSQR